MEQSLAPGSQTFEQDLFRLFRKASSPWTKRWSTPTRRPICPGSSTTPKGRPRTQGRKTPGRRLDSTNGRNLFKEFTLSLDDSEEEAA